MRALILVVVAIAGSGCVKGNPGEDDPAFTDTGGTLAIEGCGYSITTRLGAEPPRKATSNIGGDPTPRLVHLGIVGDPKTSIVAQWRTMDETTKATTIRYAEGANLSADQLTETETGITFGYRATGAQIYQVHQAHLCGLTAGTAYSYQVGSPPGDFSPVYTFHTAPDVVANPMSEVVLGILGDSRDGYDVWTDLVGQVQQRSPDLILFSGDAVTVGLTQFEWEEFFGRAEPLFARVPVVSAHGNHEVNAVNYYSQLAMPGDQENFGFDYGHAHITVANDSPEDVNTITGSTRQFLTTDFAASASARWKILMHHQPMWSASTRHGSSVTLQDAWGPVVDQYHLDLVLAGHDHDYEVSKPLVNKAVQTSSANATIYVVNGGAGADLYDNGMGFWTEYSKKTHAGGIVRVRRDSLVMDSFEPDGSALPGFTKSKP